MSKFLDEEGLKTLWTLGKDKNFLKDLHIQKVAPYLFECKFDNWDYELAREYFKEFKPTRNRLAFCSSLRKGNFYGRNFDWFYDESANFVIHCEASGGRHASLGMANVSPEITEEVAKSGEYSKFYRLLPFFTVDGINDAGVVCNTNVCPIDKGITRGTNPEGEDLCQLMLVRYVLDYADSASDAVEKLKNFNIFNNLYKMNDELHVMIADKNSTYIVEFVENTMRVLSDQPDYYDDIPGDKAIMTNFHLTDWNGEVKAVFLGDAADAVRETGLEDHAEGLERYLKLAAAYADIKDLPSLSEAMQSVYYTRTYSDLENPFWYSECLGEFQTLGNLTIYSTASEITPVREYMKEDFRKRKRDGKTWQTVHTTLYDIENKHLIIYSQENFSKGYEFDLQTLGESQILSKEEILNILNN